MSFALEFLLEIVVGVVAALFTLRIPKLQEWRDSNSATVRALGVAMSVGIFLLIAFLVFWFLIRTN